MNTRFLRRGALGLLLAVLFVRAAVSPVDTVTLRLHLNEGDSFRFKVVVNQIIDQTVMGQEQTMKQQIGMGQQFDVLAASDGVYDVKITYYWVSFEQEGPMGLITYDSDTPPETIDPMALGFAGLHGRHITMKIDTLGRVLDVGRVDAMLDAMMVQFDSLAITPPPGMKESLKLQFGDEMMKTQMENMMAIYPEEAVAIGDTWTKNVIMKVGMPMHLTNTYRLSARAGGMAQIEVESVITPHTGEPMQMGGMTLVYAMAGTQQGTMTMDEANGLPLRADITQHLTGEVTMNDSMTWPIEIQTRNVMETQ